MKGILLPPFKINEKYVAVFSWIFVFLVVAICYKRFPFTAQDVGDEDGYRIEAVYLAKYGIYYALSQGTSFFYSVFILLFSKIFFTNYLVAARILSVTSFLISCKLFL